MTHVSCRGSGGLVFFVKFCRAHPCAVSCMLQVMAGSQSGLQDQGDGPFVPRLGGGHGVFGGCLSQDHQGWARSPRSVTSSNGKEKVYVRHRGCWLYCSSQTIVMTIPHRFDEEWVAGAGACLCWYFPAGFRILEVFGVWFLARRRRWS